MRQGNQSIIILTMSVILGFSLGCVRQEDAPARASESTGFAGKWQTAVPEKLSGLPVSDGGACYLDAVNGAAIGDGPILVRSGAAISLAGWAVADVKTGRVGSALGVQLNAPTPYFMAADDFRRPGLGAALKGNSSLDGGGLKVEATPLNVPAGDYRVLFLIESDVNLLRCDTGRILRIE